MFYTLESPLFVDIPMQKVKDKHIILNQNVFRNLYYITMNKAKVLYKQTMAEQIEPLPKFKRCKATFILFPKTKRMCDIANICSAHEKFFADALVELGKLPDDNYLYWSESTYKFGKVSREYPRVDIILNATLL